MIIEIAAMFSVLIGFWLVMKSIEKIKDEL
jgi:uncharacterized protein YneF (UPF0154 family)